MVKSVSNKELEDLGITPKPKRTVKSKKDTDVSRLINSQIAATNDMVEAVKKSNNNDKLSQVLLLLTELANNNRDIPDTVPKRLKINRDKNKLITSIDIVPMTH